MTLDELTTPLSVDDVRVSIYNVLAVLGVNTTNWKPGAVIRTMIAGVAIVLAALSSLIAAIARSGFVVLAAGDWLTIAAHYDRNVDRIEATFAAGAVTLTNTGALIFSGDVGDLLVQNTTTKKLYQSTGPWALTAFGTATVAIAAIEAGTASSAFVDEITTIVSTLSGVTCTNAGTLIGLDEETDLALQARCAEKLGSISGMGPPDAYSFFAKSAARITDGTLIGVNRVATTRDGLGHVDVYVATATGAVSGTVGDLSTDLGAVDDALQRLAAPLAVTCRTHSATPLTVDLAYAVWLYNPSGLAPDAIATLIGAEIEAFFPGVPIGGNVIGAPPGAIFGSGLEAVIGRTSSALQIIRTTVTISGANPSGDLLLAATDVPMLGTVTPVIHELPSIT